MYAVPPPHRPLACTLEHPSTVVLPLCVPLSMGLGLKQPQSRLGLPPPAHAHATCARALAVADPSRGGRLPPFQVLHRVLRDRPAHDTRRRVRGSNRRLHGGKGGELEMMDDGYMDGKRSASGSETQNHSRQSKFLTDILRWTRACLALLLVYIPVRAERLSSLF